MQVQANHAIGSPTPAGRSLGKRIGRDGAPKHGRESCAVQEDGEVGEVVRASVSGGAASYPKGRTAHLPV